MTNRIIKPIAWAQFVDYYSVFFLLDSIFFFPFFAVGGDGFCLVFGRIKQLLIILILHLVNFCGGDGDRIGDQFEPDFWFLVCFEDEIQYEKSSDRRRLQ